MALNIAFGLVIELSRQFNIDESHSLKHSMEVYAYTKKIVNAELVATPHLAKQQDIIYLAAILHDMCDKKYTAELDGVVILRRKLANVADETSLDIIFKIITTMSYSTVKQRGYPDLGEYQLAYHIVREADLLSAYDIDRCIMYSMYTRSVKYDEALAIAVELFDKRVFRYIEDGLFVTEYSKKRARQLHDDAKEMVGVLVPI
jgi:HD superfamily phosphodiesterase